MPDQQLLVAALVISNKRNSLPTLANKCLHLTKSAANTTTTTTTHPIPHSKRQPTLHSTTASNRTANSDPTTDQRTPLLRPPLFLPPPSPPPTAPLHRRPLHAPLRPRRRRHARRLVHPLLLLAYPQRQRLLVPHALRARHQLRHRKIHANPSPIEVDGGRGKRGRGFGGVVRVLWAVGVGCDGGEGAEGLVEACLSVR